MIKFTKNSLVLNILYQVLLISFFNEDWFWYGNRLQMQYSDKARENT